MKNLNRTNFSRTAVTAFAALSLTGLGLTSLAAAQTAQPAQTMTMTPGAFHGLHAPTTGTVSLVQSGGKATLQIKGLKTEPGPDLQVWLYADKAPESGAKDTDIAKGKYLKVGTLKKFSGDFSFALPAGTRVNDYKSVVIWCELVSTAFGAADLK